MPKLPNEDQCNLGFPPIISLAQQIENDWQKYQLKEECFIDVVNEALMVFNQWDALSVESVGEWLGTSNLLPQQLQSDRKELFGDPPITLYFSQNFVIDFYVWMSRNISIHDHGFLGVFTVLSGEILHTEYQFISKQTFSNESLLAGELNPIKIELLSKRNKLIPIYPGSEFIHETAHLSYPTTTLCIRTVSADNIQQYEYYPFGLALETGIEYNEILKLKYISVMNQLDKTIEFYKHLCSSSEIRVIIYALMAFPRSLLEGL